MAVKILDIVSGRYDICDRLRFVGSKPTNRILITLSSRWADVENAGSRPNVHSCVLDRLQATHYADRHLFAEGFAWVCDLRPTEPRGGAIAWYEICLRFRFWCVGCQITVGFGRPWTRTIGSVGAIEGERLWILDLIYTKSLWSMSHYYWCS